MYPIGKRARCFAFSKQMCGEYTVNYAPLLGAYTKIKEQKMLTQQ